MQVTINVPDRVAAEARAKGVSVEVYVEEMLARGALDASNQMRLKSIEEAINRILELRRGNRLEGLRTKDLIHEGHKH